MHPRPLLRSLVLLVLALALAGTAVAASASGDSDTDRQRHWKPQHRGQAARCASLERTLGRLEWREAHVRGPGWLRGWLLRWHQRAIRVLSQKFANGCVAINQVQVLGTHNSYHIEPAPDWLELLLIFDDRPVGWQYNHLPLDQQFASQGIRQIELDVFADPDGGLYASPVGLRIELQEFDIRVPELEPPGIKVIHIQDLDYRTTCPSLVECLLTIKDWSDANPGHLPIFVLIEAKDEEVPNFFDLGFALPPVWDAGFFRDLDEEILSVFPAERVILPDDVRRGRASLEQAVLEDGWPSLGAARGKVFFGLDNGGAKGDAYRDGALALEGRVLFTNATPGDPDAAFVKRNDPEGQFDEIQDLVRRGYLVRTRADADTEQARSGDTTRREAALASGAQFVSSDYPEPDPRFSDYSVEIPGGFGARCNPINGPLGCRDGALEP